MKKRVILSTKLLLISDGAFEARSITKAEALEWLNNGPFENYCGHSTVRILGLEPDEERRTCTHYDEALALAAKKRLEFGREYSLEEISAIGVEFTLISRVTTISDVVDLAAKLPSGLNDPKAADKLVAERDELLEAVVEGDRIGALTEGADAVYYAAKHLDYVANLLNLSLNDLFEISKAKYNLRARHGNPKDDQEERAAVEGVIKGGGYEIHRNST